MIDNFYEYFEELGRIFSEILEGLANDPFSILFISLGASVFFLAIYLMACEKRERRRKIEKEMEREERRKENAEHWKRERERLKREKEQNGNEGNEAIAQISEDAETNKI
jgi:hypothetical protein